MSIQAPTTVEISAAPQETGTMQTCLRIDVATMTNQKAERLVLVAKNVRFAHQHNLVILNTSLV
jgi:hypothetical protein